MLRAAAAAKQSLCYAHKEDRRAFARATKDDHGRQLRAGLGRVVPDDRRVIAAGRGVRVAEYLIPDGHVIAHGDEASAAASVAAARVAPSKQT